MAKREQWQPGTVRRIPGREGIEGADLVEQIRAAIKNSGLSLSELGRRSGVSLPQITRFVKGERGITLGAAAKLCVALGLRLTATARHKSK